MKIGEKLIEIKSKKKIERKAINEGTEIHLNTIKKIEDTGDGVLSKILTVFNYLGYNKAKLTIWKEAPNGKKSGKCEINL
jgi:hypothetical protein